MNYDEVMGVAGDTALAEWITQPPAGASSSWNLKPTQNLPVAFTDHKNGEKRFETAYWSIVPIWSKTLKTKFPTFNARSETVTEKASFKNSVKNRRCVIPVTAFYEWTGPKGDRTPHVIFGPEKILPMAGLMSWWHEPGAGDDDGWHLTATILTRESAGVMKPLHDRMPVFMSDELLEDWIDPNTVGDKLLVDAVSEASILISDQLTEHVVAPLRGDGPELIKSVG